MNRDNSAGKSDSDPCGGCRWVLVVSLLICAGVLPLAYWDTHAPDRIARHERMKRERHQHATDVLRRAAVAALPPDATEVTVTKDEWPVGWLTFVRVADGKRVKFLVCYQQDVATGTMNLSVARAD